MSVNFATLDIREAISGLNSVMPNLEDVSRLLEQSKLEALSTASQLPDGIRQQYEDMIRSCDNISGLLIIVANAELAFQHAAGQRNLTHIAFKDTAYAELMSEISQRQEQRDEEAEQDGSKVKDLAARYGIDTTEYDRAIRAAREAYEQAEGSEDKLAAEARLRALELVRAEQVRAAVEEQIESGELHPDALEEARRDEQEAADARDRAAKRVGGTVEDSRKLNGVINHAHTTGGEGLANSTLEGVETGTMEIFNEYGMEGLMDHVQVHLPDYAAGVDYAALPTAAAYTMVQTGAAVEDAAGEPTLQTASAGITLATPSDSVAQIDTKVSLDRSIEGVTLDFADVPNLPEGFVPSHTTARDSETPSITLQS